MPVAFKGELTRHIIKCYPAGKAHDKKPVPNELSMLIFYLQSRPTKIPKASTMLSARAQSYSSKDNTGNLVVTALIMHEIVTNNYDNFSLFAEGALEIIQLLVDKSHGNDTEILKLAESLFAEFNRHHTGVLFSGSKTYRERFLGVVGKFAKIAVSSSTASRVIATRALTSLSYSPALATKVGQQGLVIAVKSFEANAPSDASVFRAVTEATDEGETSVDNADLEFNTVLGLRQYLNTPSLDQISNILTRVLHWLVKGSDGDWQPALVAYMARWVPPQNRFLVTKSVVASMAELPPDAVKEASRYCAYLEALLTAAESKIGLSVVEVLRQLLKVQHRLIRSPAESVDGQSIQNLIVRLRKNIGYLANTRVYPDQTSDMMAEILSKYTLSALPATTTPTQTTQTTPTQTAPATTTPAKSDAESSNESVAVSNGNGSGSFTFPRPLGIIINDFRVLMEIQNSSPKDQRRLNLSLWEGTQWLLTSHHPQLLVLYATTFSTFLEAAQPSAHPSSKRGSVITRQLCECARRDLAPVSYIAIYYCLVALTKFQAVACQYLLPWILAILSTDIKPSDAVPVADQTNEAKVCRESIALATLLAVFRKLNLESLASLTFEQIGERVKQNRWLPGITFPPAVTVEVAVSSLVNNPKLLFASESELGNELGSEARNGSSLFQSYESGILSSNLDAPDIEFILNPGYALDASPDTDDVRGSQLPSSTDALSAKRSFSTVSQSSTESTAPRMIDLRKRQEDVRSLSTMKTAALPNRETKISLPTKRNSSATIKYSEADLLSILDKISIDEGQSKGNLTI